MSRKFLSPGNIIQLSAREKNAAIREVISGAATFRDLPDPEGFEESVLEREALGTTGLGHGVAFAHGKVPDLPRMKVALGISRRGIDFHSIDGLPVHLLFVVATHPDMHIDYLRCLSTLARMARRKGFREEILACVEEEEIESRIGEAYTRARGCAEAP